MSSRQSRREFLKTVAASAGALAGARVFGAPNILAAPAATSKLRMAVIGCGGQGTNAHVPTAAREQLVALVDADDKNLAKALKRAKDVVPDIDTRKVRTFTDYRRFFDTMAREIDAVIIATPNHHHALPALMAMKLGKGVYVEKPLSYDIAEARTMAEYAAKYKVATQMGNQGHSGEGYRRLCEYIWAGAIGNVTEVHCWSDRANGGIGGRPPVLPVPAGLHWDNWIGPAPYRDYHKDLHPHEWHGWHDFGDGSLGNMGCHVLDGAHWALKLGHPTSIEAEDIGGGTEERYPVRTRIRWDYPARGEMPPVKVYWYDGKRDVADATGTGETPDSVKKGARNRPPIAIELEKKYSRDFGGNGSIYVGDQGYMHSDTYGGSVRIVPEEKQKEFPVPPKTLPRVTGGHAGDFLRACRDGQPASSHFETSAKLTEMILLGCLAIKAGLKRKIEWNGEKMQVTNLPEVNQFVKRDYRRGWAV